MAKVIARLGGHAAAVHVGHCAWCVEGDACMPHATSCPVVADGGNVELVEIDGPVVYLRLQGACGSCPSSLTTMTMGIKRRLQERIPVRPPPSTHHPRSTSNNQGRHQPLPAPPHRAPGSV